MKTYKTGDIIQLSNGDTRTVIRDRTNGDDNTYQYATIDEDGEVKTKWFDSLERLNEFYADKVARSY